MNDEISGFEAWTTTFRPSGGKSAHPCWNNDSTQPLLTVDDLRSLEPSYIASDASLRHEMNFQAELHFRRNEDSPAAKQFALRYWTAVKAEIEFYAFMLHPEGSKYRFSQEWSLHFRQGQRRIPQMLIAIREILISLAPVTEHADIKRVIDVDLIAQQVERGIYDARTCMEWLGARLKDYCAPMRDRSIDEMLQRMRDCENDPGREAQILVQTMEHIFAILEVMRLDVANHAIRSWRPSFLDSTFQFEMEHFQDKVTTGELDVHGAKIWYRLAVLDHCRKHDLEKTKLANRFTAFTSTWMRTAFSGLSSLLPDTFQLDLGRLETLHNRFQSLDKRRGSTLSLQEEADPVADSIVRCTITLSNQLLASTPSDLFDELEKNGAADDEDRIARTAAHITLLHWRVFQPLVYEVNEDTRQKPRQRAYR